MTPEEAADVVRVIEHGWSRPVMVPETALLYIGSLVDLDYEDTKAAVLRLLRVAEYRPSVAAIRREVAQAAGLLPPSLEQALAQAHRWCQWREQAGWQNGLGEVSVQPETHHVVVRVCRSLTVGPSDPTWPHVFRAAYREAVGAAERVVLSGSRLGLGEGS